MSISGGRVESESKIVEAMGAIAGGKNRGWGRSVSLDRGGTLLILILLLLFAAVLVRTAWVSEDAYITFRTVDNFVHGHGLTWNIDERVQTYSHPLWMLLVSAVVFLTRESFFSVIILSLLVSLVVAVLLARRIAPSPREAALGLVCLLSSKAFVDYSSSGLENPLTHLLLIVFLAGYFTEERTRNRLLFLALIASLAAVNRLDTILLYIPPLAEATFRTQAPKKIRTLALGFIPLFVWEAFSFVYYGFLLPNSFYAKLRTGIPAGELAAQGTSYLLNSLRMDPVTLFIIAAGIAASLVMRNRRSVFPAFGILLYTAYVIRIGGDFMSGRFLTAPFIVSVVLITRIPIVSAATAALMAIVAGGFGLAGPHPPLLSDAAYSDTKIDERGIADERGFYYQVAGLLKAGRNVKLPALNRESGFAAKTRGGVAINGAAGYFGYFAGPAVHIVDPLGVCDALLSRLPSIQSPDWRIGHFARVVPGGYVESLTARKNVFRDKKLGEYYRKLMIIIRGELWSIGRFREILKMNLGSYEDLIDRKLYRNPPR
jgi:arabinofuranosyltransferase